MVPSLLDYVKTDVSGNGVSIYQQSQTVVRELVRKGRCGLLVNFLAPTDRPVSVADKPRAVIEVYKAEDIVNWKVERRGSEFKTTMVILKYQQEVRGSDGYEVTYRDALLELRLLRDGYVAYRWERSSGDWEKVASVMPLDAAGKPLQEIPFLFVGSETNTATIDAPPMLGICNVNIGLWNNSAEFEDSVFVIGQPQPWMSGATAEHIAGIKYIGSSTLIGVPENQVFTFAQPTPNSLVREAMQDKIQALIGLGASFVEPGSSVKTATQSEGEQRVSHSILSLIASNTSEAYTQCLRWLGMFMGASDNVEFTVSQDFVKPTDTAMLAQIMAAFATRALPLDSYLAALQKYGLVDPERTIEQFAGEVDDGRLSLDAFRH